MSKPLLSTFDAASEKEGPSTSSGRAVFESTREPGAVHAALRRGTRAEHDRVDAAYSRFDLTDRADYARFLLAQARAFLPVEAALESGPVPAMASDWTAHRRADALRADLRALNITEIVPLPAPPLPTAAEALGGWYVLEGSRLGGAMLARSVGPHFPRAFLATPGPKWRRSLELLNKHLYDGSELERALGAARAVFALFERAALELD